MVERAVPRPLFEILVTDVHSEIVYVLTYT